MNLFNNAASYELAYVVSAAEASRPQGEPLSNDARTQPLLFRVIVALTQGLRGRFPLQPTYFNVRLANMKIQYQSVSPTPRFEQSSYLSAKRSPNLTVFLLLLRQVLVSQPRERRQDRLKVRMRQARDIWERGGDHSIFS